MNKLNIKLLLLGLFLFAFIKDVPADDGIFAGAFLRMGLGARANAMGGAFTGVAEGAVAAYYNPAGIPFLEKREIMLSYRFLSLDRNFNYIGFATGVRPKVEEGSNELALNGGLALSWIHAGVDNIDGRDFAGNHYQNFSNSEHAFALSFGVMPIKNKLAIGLTGRVLYNRFPDMGDENATISDTGLGVDLGVLIKPLPYLSVGFVIKNINAKYSWKTDKLWEKDIDKIDRFPQTFRGGIALRYPYPWLLLAADIEKNNQQDLKYFIGTEALLLDQFAARAGLNNGSPTLGGGYLFQLFSRSVQIQYAFVTKKYDAASEHIFSWVFNL
ncbi:PorV/PorQ family protein [candidate division KSB1 bacterium]|nr:PorV/PorQ family protein [candidate division KSB1 bacterium]